MDPLREYHEGVEKKKTRLIKWEKRGLLGFNSRVAMVGDLSANVGLMFS